MDLGGIEMIGRVAILFAVGAFPSVPQERRQRLFQLERGANAPSTINELQEAIRQRFGLSQLKLSLLKYGRKFCLVTVSAFSGMEISCSSRRAQ